jgi:ssDNA-binding Zn-finger/Zn-ribbon topoisomerase 1
MATQALHKAEPKQAIVRCRTCNDSGLIVCEESMNRFAGRDSIPGAEYLATCVMHCLNCAKGEELRPMIETEQKLWREEHG